mgnify:FL=1
MPIGNFYPPYILLISTLLFNAECVMEGYPHGIHRERTGKSEIEN